MTVRRRAGKRWVGEGVVEAGRMREREEVCAEKMGMILSRARN